MMEPDTPNSPNVPEVSATAPSTGQDNTSAHDVAPTPLVYPQLEAMPDEERQTLLAALAASRELGPEMDRTVADHYFEQRALAQSRVLRRQQRTPRTFGQRARQFVSRLRERRLLGPILVGAVALAGVVGVAAFATIATLHGFPHPGPWMDHQHGFSYQSGGGNAQNTQPPNGSGPDGFFPLFGVFPWLIPLLLLFIFMRRRALMRRYQRYQRYQGQLSQGNGPALPPGYQGNQAAPPAEDVQPTQPTPARPTYTGYQPYDPFGVTTSTAANSAHETNALPIRDDAQTNAAPATPPAQPPTGVTNEVSPPPATKPLSNPAG